MAPPHKLKCFKKQKFELLSASTYELCFFFKNEILGPSCNDVHKVEYKKIIKSFIQLCVPYTLLYKDFCAYAKLYDSKS
jgi:hypothetical protein